MKASFGLLAPLVAASLAAIVAVLSLPAFAQSQVAAADATVFPCSAAAAAPAGKPAIKVWQGAELGPSWKAPACTGWAPGPVRLVVSMASRFRGPASVDEVLARAGAISLLKDVKYWSNSRGRWAPMLSSAEALSAPDITTRRADFSAAELRAGRPLYFLANDAGPASRAIFRTRVAGASDTQAMVELENVTTISMLGITLFNPGDIRAFSLIARQPDASWQSHFLVRIDGKANSMLQGDGGAYVNRAAAYMRHLAGTPTDAEPPAMR